MRKFSEDRRIQGSRRHQCNLCAGRCDGGGLLAGPAVAARSIQPKIKVMAVGPANADDAAQSLRAGRRLVTEKKFTSADGLRSNVGERKFEIIQRYVDDIVTVSEEAIV